MIQINSLLEVEQTLTRWRTNGSPSMEDIWILKNNIQLDSPPDEVKYYYESWEFLKLSLINVLTGKWTTDPGVWPSYLVRSDTDKMPEVELVKCQQDYDNFKEKKVREFIANPFERQHDQMLYRWLMFPGGENYMYSACSAWVSIIKRINALNVDTGGFYGNIAFNITDSKQGILLGRTSQELTSTD
jgi:hypothetical protein